MPVWSIIFSKMVDILYDVDREHQAKQSLHLALIFGALGVLFFFAAIMQEYGLGVVGERLSSTLKKKTFSALLRQESGYFDWFANNSYTINQRLTTNTAMVQTATIKPIGFGMQAIATFVTGLVISFAHGWKLALVGLAVIPILVGTAMLQYKYILSFSGTEKETFEFAGALSANALQNIRAVQAANAQSSIIDLFASKLAITGAIGQRRALISGCCFGLFYLGVCSSYAVCFWYSAVLIQKGEITFANAMVVIFSVVVAAVDVGQTAARLLPGLGTAQAAQNELFRMMNRKSQILEADAAAEVEGAAAESGGGGDDDDDDALLDGTTRTDASADSIVLKDVWFTYPARPLAPVLKGLSLTVKRGETMAVVGQSGGGKSSIFNLMLRLYEPHWGTIEMNGKSIYKEDIKKLRAQIGAVGQQPQLFEASIAENIAYGAGNPSQGAIRFAAQMAGADDFILDLPSGYETEVGSLALSGGQKQRIAIARALVRNPPLILLDEATSALDSESEAVVQRSLNKLMQDPNRTVMVIAHRLATVRHADRIAVVDNGAVAELGSHDELMAWGGIYAGLIAASEE